MAQTPSPEATRSKPPSWRPRFGIWSLLVATTLIAVASAMLGGMLREGPASTGLYVILAAAAPLAVMVAAGIARLLSELRDSAHRHRDP